MPELLFHFLATRELRFHKPVEYVSLCFGGRSECLSLNHGLT